MVPTQTRVTAIGRRFSEEETVRMSDKGREERTECRGTFGT